MYIGRWNNQWALYKFLINYHYYLSIVRHSKIQHNNYNNVPEPVMNYDWNQLLTQKSSMKKKTIIKSVNRLLLFISSVLRLRLNIVYCVFLLKNDCISFVVLEAQFSLIVVYELIKFWLCSFFIFQTIYFFQPAKYSIK